MNFIFNNEFLDNSYSTDAASADGRFEAIMDVVNTAKGIKIIQTNKADYFDIENVHNADYILKVRQNDKLYQMALLAAGGAIAAAEMAMIGEPSFACIRPPGHHAYRSMGWGYCYFNNMGIALKKLKKQGLIRNAFILDFDAHTGDGTIEVLSDWKEVSILNPYAENNIDYIKVIEDFIRNLSDIDIIAVNAGFDSYIHDLGKKLQTFDFYKIGFLMKKLSKRMGHGRRFAILEGGYYQPDLGKNVLAFCQGFQD